MTRIRRRLKALPSSDGPAKFNQFKCGRPVMRNERWIAIALLAATGGACEAATVRGKVLNGNVPAAGITVTVVNQKTGATVSPVQSATNGMYYIPNVSPGTYTLEVWRNPNGKPVKYPNIVVTNPVTDVGPIALR